MYCSKCGARLEDGTQLCIICGNYTENHMTSSEPKKPLIKVISCIALVIVLIVTGVLGVKSYRKHNISERVQAIQDAYLEQDYNRALELAYKLPNKHQQYYVDFLLYAKEIDNWSGTCSELIDWLDTSFKSIDEHGYLDANLPDEYHWNCYGFYVRNAIEGFSKEELTEILAWYPSLKEYEEECFSEYFNLLCDNRDLFSISSGDGVLAISTVQIERNDERAENWYMLHKETVSEWRTDCNSEWVNNAIESFSVQMDDFHEDYWNDHSLSQYYDLSEKENIYVTEEAAINNYDVLNSRIKICVGILNLDNQFHDANDSMSYDEEMQEYYLSHNDMARELINIVHEVFDNAMPEITDGVGLTIAEAVEQSISSVLAQRS